MPGLPLATLLLAPSALALTPPSSGAPAVPALDSPRLSISQEHGPLAPEHATGARAAAWAELFALNPGDWTVRLDARGGTPVTLLGRVPMIPGTGSGNLVGLCDGRAAHLERERLLLRRRRQPERRHLRLSDPAGAAGSVNRSRPSSTGGSLTSGRRPRARGA